MLRLRSLALVAAVLLLANLGLPQRAGATACANYPYPPTSNRCHQDGFCVSHDLRTRTINDGVPETDDPPSTFAVQADPVTVSTDAMVGAADLFAIGQGDMTADRSVVLSGGGASADAPFGVISTSAESEVDVLSVMRVTDLVFSGPTAEVDTSLHLVFDGSFQQIAVGTETASAHSRVIAVVGGAICGGMSHVEFDGQRALSWVDPGGGGDNMLIVSTNFGILEDVAFDQETELVVGPFTVPTGEPLQFEIWLRTVLSANTDGGDADSDADFALHAGPIGGGLVFELPSGYSADSAQAGIAGAQTVPEPHSLGMAAIALLALVCRSGRRVLRSPWCAHS